jgi:hypothetical protein
MDILTLKDIQTPKMGKKTANSAALAVPNNKHYSFLNFHKNPEYDGGLIPISFESCLIGNKSDKKTDQNPVQKFIKTKPKWLTDLAEWTADPETGEMVMTGVYQSNDFKKANRNKIKALDNFCGHYQPLYSTKKVTLLFLTFTQANKANLAWKDMVENISLRFKRIGCPIRGYVWTAEISENLHFHYHICVAIDRVKWKKIPKQLKFESLWGKRTEIDFVKKNVRHYMAKYFAKHNYRITNQRSYGRSSKYR